MIASGGKVPNISKTHTIIVYNPIDGRVVHLHKVVIFEGGKTITHEDAEREAVEHARRFGHDTDRLAIHHLTEQELPSQGGLHVEFSNGTARLVAARPLRLRPHLKRL